MKNIKLPNWILDAAAIICLVFPAIAIIYANRFRTYSDYRNFDDRWGVIAIFSLGVLFIDVVLFFIDKKWIKGVLFSAIFLAALIATFLLGFGDICVRGGGC